MSAQTGRDLLASLDARLAAQAPLAPAVYRLGLGVTILLAGAHKLVDPGAWTAYALEAVVAAWPLDADATMVANGVIEVIVGAAILADRYASLAAAVVAVSLVGVVLNLLAVAATTGAAVDVLIRDVGLTALAAGVALEAAGGEST